jgi:hypothetical protein
MGLWGSDRLRPKVVVMDECWRLLTDSHRRVRLVVWRDGLGDQSEPRVACAWGC